MGELAALLAAAMWAFASILWTRLGREGQDEIVLNFLKCSLAGLILAGALFLLEGRIWPANLSRSDFLWLAASGLFGLTLGDSAYFHALTRIGPRRALLIWALAPGVSALLAWPLLGEPLHRTMLLGMALTLGGVVWVVLERAPSDEDTGERQGLSKREWVGIACAFGAVLGQASANVLVKLGGEEAGSLALSVVRLCVASVGLGLGLGVIGRLARSMEPLKTARSTRLVVIATVTGTCGGLWLSAYGLLHAEVGVAATLNSTSPIFVLPLSLLLQGERISLRAVCGAFVAVGGIAVFFLT